MEVIWKEHLCNFNAHQQDLCRIFLSDGFCPSVFKYYLLLSQQHSLACTLSWHLSFTDWYYLLYIRLCWTTRHIVHAGSFSANHGQQIPQRYCLHWVTVPHSAKQHYFSSRGISIFFKCGACRQLGGPASAVASTFIVLFLPTRK